MNFLWAFRHPDLYHTLCLFSIHELNNPIRYSYRATRYVKQNGPHCGLVALAMCTPNPSTKLVKDIFEIAKANYYTNNGEMFSASDMEELAKEILPKKTKVKLYSGSLNTKAIKESILNGDILLVPYDNGPDNGPCLRKGHSAHWAVIIGGVETASDFYVIARHGQTRMLLVWKLSDLALSNAQLTEISPKRKSDKLKYKLPLDGIGGLLGLRCQTVILSNL